MSAGEYRQASLRIWEAMAAGWESDRGFVWDASRGVGEWMVDALEPQPGETILELAAGLGDTGFAAAARVGEGGRLITTDFSAPMVEAARRRAEELGISNAEFRTMDAERMVVDLAGAIAMVLRSLPDEEQAAVRERVQQELQPYEEGQGYRLEGSCLNVLAA